MKNLDDSHLMNEEKRKHIVPLSTQAIGVLEIMKQIVLIDIIFA